MFGLNCLRVTKGTLVIVNCFNNPYQVIRVHFSHKTKCLSTKSQNHHQSPLTVNCWSINTHKPSYHSINGCFNLFWSYFSLLHQLGYARINLNSIKSKFKVYQKSQNCIFHEKAKNGMNFSDFSVWIQGMRLSQHIVSHLIFEIP